MGLFLFFQKNRKITRLPKASIQREQNPSEKNQKSFFKTVRFRPLPRLPDRGIQRYSPSESEEAVMRHNLKISVSKAPQNAGIITCRTVSIREHLLRFLFGSKQRVTILIPGDSVDEVSICETGKGGMSDE